jgi:[acyl-carrier-protein] S-malonyltransferase
MAAVLGLDPERVRAAVVEARAAGAGRVQLANFNAPNQIVISGDRVAVERAAELASAAGAKRIVRLNVSGAWHSELMEPAREPFGRVLAGARIAAPRFLVVSNVDARPYADVESIRTNLLRSISAEVLWHETAVRLIAEGLDLVVECGASAVLAPLVKRLPGAPAVLHVGDAGGVERLRARLTSSDAA